MLKDDKGEPAPVYSIASGLDYPSVGPEHAFLRDLAECSTTPSAMRRPWTHSSSCPAQRHHSAIAECHAVAYAMRKAKEMKQGSILVNLSGRGDKDIDYVVEHYGYGEQFFK